QPGASANTLAVGDDAVLLIQIDASSAGTLFFFSGGGGPRGSGSIVRGLVINHLTAEAFNFGPGTGLPSNNNTIAGNFIGTDATGTTFLGGTGGAISAIFDSSTGNTIGGTAPADRNVIVGGTINLSSGGASGTIVRGNYI